MITWWPSQLRLLYVTSWRYCVCQRLWTFNVVTSLVFVSSVLNVRPVFVVSLYERRHQGGVQEYTTDTTQHSHRPTLRRHGDDVTVTNRRYGDKWPPEGVRDGHKPTASRIRFPLYTPRRRTWTRERCRGWVRTVNLRTRVSGRTTDLGRTAGGAGSTGSGTHAGTSGSSTTPTPRVPERCAWRDPWCAVGSEESASRWWTGRLRRWSDAGKNAALCGQNAKRTQNSSTKYPKHTHSRTRSPSSASAVEVVDVSVLRDEHCGEDEHTRYCHVQLKEESEELVKFRVSGYKPSYTVLYGKVLFSVCLYMKLSYSRTNLRRGLERLRRN